MANGHHTADCAFKCQDTPNGDIPSRPWTRFKSKARSNAERNGANGPAQRRPQQGTSGPQRLVQQGSSNHSVRSQHLERKTIRTMPKDCQRVRPSMHLHG